MTARVAYVLIALALAWPRTLLAQEVARTDLEVRTFTFRHISPDNAVKVVEPYIVSREGGVFGPASHLMQAITVRETPRVLARIDSVLARLDKPPSTIRLRFQLVAAQDQPSRDPRISALDSTLRDLFRFQGYRLLAQTVVSVGEWNPFSQTFAADADRFLLTGHVRSVSTSPDSGRVSLEVTLSRGPTAGAPAEQRGGSPEDRILSTGLSIPIGQTVVLGSGVSGESIQALILVVTPEPAGGREP